jgi:hypothetical protein
MNEIDRIRKSLTDTKAGEKGWRRSLIAAEGSFSRTLAENNLIRLAALRELLLSQLSAANLPQHAGVDAATKHGLISP